MVVVINHVRGYDNREDRRNSERLVAAMVARFHRWISPNHIVAVPYDPHIATAGRWIFNSCSRRPGTGC